MAIVEISIVPLGTGTTGISSFVAGCVEVVRGENDLNYQLTPMGTVIEGNIDRIFSVIRRMHEQPFIAGAERVLTSIRVDDRRDSQGTMAGKVAAVEKKLTPRET